MYTPNLRLRVPVPGRQREQGHFRGSTMGALRVQGRALSEQQSTSEHYGAAQRRNRWEAELAFSVSA